MADDIIWSVPSDARALVHVVLMLVPLIVVYDFFYTLFHRALHHRSIYKYVHKHHHRQKAPSRGNVDAVNVHPFEFVSGEYNHLLAVFLVGHYIGQLHFATVILLLVLGSFLTTLNHTRFDVVFPYFSSVYQSKYHDIHHWYPDSNYGQYIMLWDHVFGWFKPVRTFVSAVAKD